MQLCAKDIHSPELSNPEVARLGCDSRASSFARAAASNRSGCIRLRVAAHQSCLERLQRHAAASQGPVNATWAFSGDFSAAPITATAAHLVQVKTARSFIMLTSESMPSESKTSYAFRDLKTQQAGEVLWQSPSRPDKCSAAERLLVHLRTIRRKAESLVHLWTSKPHGLVRSSCREALDDGKPHVGKMMF